MHVDADGFNKPVVDESNCIECGVCLNVCAFNHPQPAQEHDFNIQCFAAWSKDPEIRQLCTSGGVAFELARFLMDRGYQPLVCRFNPQRLRAEHFIASNEPELFESIGSKYIQSDSFNGFKHIKKGQKYFIAGTPCQIDSVRRYIRLKKMEDDVILMDFFCHGVPSILLWDKYIGEVQQKTGAFENIIWRDKETGWHDSWVMKIPGRYASWFSRGDLFYKMFLGDRCLGKQCYHNCKYKYDKSAADIRIGDLWGRKYQNNEKGVNGVVCFTEKGSEAIYQLQNILHIENSTLEIVGESQMKECAHQPSSYNYVMKSLKSDKSLQEIDKEAWRLEKWDRISRKLKYYIFRLPSKILEIVHLKKRPLK